MQTSFFLLVFLLHGFLFMKNKNRNKALFLIISWWDFSSHLKEQGRRGWFLPAPSVDSQGWSLSVDWTPGLAELELCALQHLASSAFSGIMQSDPQCRGGHQGSALVEDPVRGTALEPSSKQALTVHQGRGLRAGLCSLQTSWSQWWGNH